MSDNLVPNIKITKLREYEIAMICPFCGTTKGLGMGEEFAQSAYFVSCMECPKVRGPLRASRESAVKAWNERRGNE